MLKMINKILTGTAVSLLMGVLLATVLIPKILGLVPLAITSESMTPTLPVGTLVVMKPVTPAEVPLLADGTVVTFQQTAGGPYITHRIVGFSEGIEGTKLITQGDANNAPDEAVGPEQVHARLAYSVPYLGMLSGSVSGEAKGAIAKVAGGLLLLVASSSVVLQLRTKNGRRVAGKIESAEQA